MVRVYERWGYLGSVGGMVSQMGSIGAEAPPPQARDDLTLSPRPSKMGIFLALPAFEGAPLWSRTMQKDKHNCYRYWLPIQWLCVKTKTASRRLTK